MITQELLSFVKKEIVSGKSTELIKSELLTAGWNQIDIEECFSQLDLTNKIQFNRNTPTAINTNPNKTKKIILLIVILFVVSIGALAYYNKNDLSKFPVLGSLFHKQEKAQISQPQNIKPIQQPEVQKQEVQNAIVNEPVVETTIGLPAISNKIVPTAPVISKIAPNSITKQVIANIVDCGSIRKPMEFDGQEKAQSCFDQKFKDCSPAKLVQFTLDPSSELNLDRSVNYLKSSNEILGYKDKFCLVKFTYLKSQNSNWDNKSMTCNYDNSKNFSDNNFYNSDCSGPLLTAMTTR